ncbi:sigma 54-interacting transcriptional regulator [Nocardia testacea]
MPGPLPHLQENGTLLVLRGNSGSGKSPVACALHQHSQRLMSMATMGCAAGSLAGSRRYLLSRMKTVWLPKATWTHWPPLVPL